VQAVEGGMYNMFQVVKRDGEIAEFQMAKITSAIDKAFDAKEKTTVKI
jgi:ATP cone domain.